MTIQTLSESMSYIAKVASPNPESDRKYRAFPAGDFFVYLQDFFGVDAVTSASQILFKGIDESGMTPFQERLYRAIDQNTCIKSKLQSKVLAQLHVGKGYIERLSHSPDCQLIQVAGFDFFRALMKVYGKEAVERVRATVMRWSGTTYQGMAPFQSRFAAAFEKNALLSIADQKYIENLFRIL